MIREQSIARLFFAVLIIGLLCVGYVVLTSPTGMISYEIEYELKQKQEKPNSNQEMKELFEEHWDEVREEIVILKENVGN
jgi:TRAP-type C4-dicarboxylate transport system permease large subunit